MALPGHTHGHTGYSTPDGVLYSGDALLGLRVLEAFGVPYHEDPCMAAGSLERLLDAVDRFEAVVPGHGPVMRSGEAAAAVEANLARVREAGEALVEDLSRQPLTPGEAAVRLASRFSPRALAEPGLLALLEETVRGYIGCLSQAHRLEPQATSRGVAWRALRG
jgi:glyoxylase-like metal-dependent hydrolase (beta-lactamase superfamily II)